MTKEAVNNQTPKGSTRIATRFVLYTVLASTLIATLTSAFQLYVIYDHDVNEIKSRLNEIQNSYLETIASRVWVGNKQDIHQTIEGLIRLPDIEHIQIFENNKLIVTEGAAPTSNTIVRVFPLEYVFHSKKKKIGHIRITASLSHTYQNLFDQAIAIIASNMIKTFLVSGFMLFIFYHLVARHLNHIAEFAETINQNTLQNRLTLNRPKKQRQKDEFDVVVDAIHTMQQNIELFVSQLSNSEQNLSQTLNSIGDAVVTTDDEGNITRLNPVAEKLMSCTTREVIGKPLKSFFKIIDATTRLPIPNPVEKVLATGETVYLSNHTTLISGDRTEYQIADSAAPIRNENNEIIGMVLVFNDVTEQYHLRETARTRQRDMQAIMDFSPAVIYVKDTEGRYLFTNLKFEKIFNLSRTDIIGNTDLDLFEKDFAQEFQHNDSLVIKNGQPLEMEEIAPLADGFHTYHSIKFPLLDDDKNIYAVCGISTDITEAKSKDEILRRSQKMDALGKLTGGIAHDYNNMLSVILGYSDLIQKEATNQPKLLDHISKIIHAGNRGAQLTQKLLSFSKTTPPKTTELNLNDFFLQERDLLQKTLTVSINLEYNLADDLWLTLLDENELEDSVLNICINAMHAMSSMKPEKTLAISTRNQLLTKNEAEKYGLSNEGEYVLMSFSDTGCGIDEDSIKNVFDPFFTTKGTEGTGLGLSQVMGFVKRNNGAITITSKLDFGTQISIYFPRHINATSTASLQLNDIDSALNGTETILIVDDEPALQQLSSELLCSHGYKVICANNGTQAIEIIKKESIDLLLSDVIMPEMDGHQLSEYVQKHFPNTKIQLVSGFTDDKLYSGSTTNLRTNLLQKPFELNTLLTRVRKLLDS